MLLVAVEGWDAVVVVDAFVTKTPVTLTRPLFAGPIFPADRVIHALAVPTLSFPSLVADEVVEAIQVGIAGHTEQAAVRFALPNSTDLRCSRAIPVINAIHEQTGFRAVVAS